MMSFHAYKLYHRRNSLYIRKCEQIAHDFPELANKCYQQIAIAKTKEQNLLSEYPNYQIDRQ